MTQTRMHCPRQENKIPQSVGDVMKSPNKGECLNDMDKEMASLRKNETWNLVDLPAEERTVNTKSICAEEEPALSYKARSVAKGCSQHFGVDYGDTFSPDVRYSTSSICSGSALDDTFASNRHKLGLFE